MNNLTNEFLAKAKSILGDSGWSEDPDKLHAAASPWRATSQGETPFLAMPGSTDQASALVRLCADHRVALTPQGGNTGLVDGGTPHGEITVSMRRMTRIRALDKTNNSLTIEAGAPLVDAQNAADDANRLFPLSLGSEGIATIGGLISTNAGGVAVLRYGMMRDLLLGLEVVLPSGEVWNGLSGLRKNNTGYDLKHLFAGAEGTLGLITAATLKLFPKVAKATGWVICKSAEDVVDLLALVRDHAGDTVTSFEIIPANAIEMVTADIPDTRDPAPSALPWRVLVEVSMAREDQARETLMSALADAMEKDLADNAIIAESGQQADSFWHIRETIPLSKRAYGTAINHDVAVPVSAIPEFLKTTEAAIHKVDNHAEIVAFGHVGDGNLHYSACEPLGVSESTLARHADEITQIVHTQAMKYGGSISAEHGVGRLKRDELASIRPQAATDTMRAIKQALDPLGIMNPGRVVSMSD
ncbi:FAD-binding oxidoreductase [Henriciella litoralis]|uniref:FAD-binding oxidoreductase n=1 Tax=Henriciella litoralis TaxID=568102 RepID=UPI000A02742B|nr:FAD-binding oxidoreductase [Henriciella litoralis]